MKSSVICILISSILFFSCERTSRSILGKWKPNSDDNFFNTVEFTIDGNYIVHFKNNESIKMKYSYDLNKPQKNLQVWPSDSENIPMMNGTIEFIDHDTISIIMFNGHQLNSTSFSRLR